MRKLLNKPWVVGLLALAAIAFVGQSLLPYFRSAGTGTAPADSGAPADETAANDPAQDAASATTTALKLTPPTRDPFPQLQTTKAAEGTPAEALPDILETVRLSALWVQDGKTFVVLNEQILAVGQQIGRLTLEKASLEGVWLSHWRGHNFLELGHEFTLATPASHPPAAPVVVSKS